MPKYLLALALAAASLPVNAQIIRGYGIKAGPTSSAMRSPDITRDGGTQSFDSVRRYGVAVFIFGEWLEHSTLSVATEAGYVQRGYATEHEGRDEQNNPIGTIRLDTKFDYLSTAALVKVRYPTSMVAPYVLAGPRLDFFLGGDEDNSLTAEYSKTAFGGTVGIGTETSMLLPLEVFGEIRYSFDVTNSLPDVPRDAYNNAFDLLIGVRL